mgnify:CR=1 FL=1
MIKKGNELNFADKKMSLIIQGSPGVGKTTIAQSAPKVLTIDADKCKSCGLCAAICPTGAINSFKKLPKKEQAEKVAAAKKAKAAAAKEAEKAKAAAQA